MPRYAPWSVKGVSPEAREAAKLAARKAGVPLGVWLAQTILSAAAQELKRNAPAGSWQPRQNWDDEDDDDTVYAGQGGPPAPLPEALIESIQKLVRRIDDTEARTTEALLPIAEKVSQLSQRIDEQRQTSGSALAVERAVTRMAERLERLEHQTGGAGRGGEEDRPAVEHPQRPGLFSRLFGD